MEKLSVLVLLYQLEMEELEISKFPVLKNLSFLDCKKMKKIVVNGTSLRKLEITGDMTDLEIVDVQTPTLKSCFLTDLVTTKKELTVVFKFTVPGY
jgi:hypothetical protein